ncbi:hypothetical protein ACF1AJ_17575 [Leifsonia sp. NPDC014704]|uniref:hypothetical protein n=1 Tax=Leifsonia sp. NPDC014704 TaxID=3364123 RepID=UPI0036F472DA
MTLFECLDEIEAWLNEKRPFDPKFHVAAWRGAIADAQEAATVVGPALRDQVTLAELEGRLRDVIRGLSGKPDSTLRAAATEAIVALRIASRSGTARVAAFDDLVAAVKQKRTNPSRVLGRLDLLCDVLRLGNFDVLVTAAHGAGLLAGEFGLDAAGNVIPALDASLRLGQFRAHLLKPPKSGHGVVWMSYEPARLGNWKAQVGSVTFYEASVLRELLEHGDDLGQLPTELEGSLDNRLFDGEDKVAVRVDLGTREPGDLIGDARAIADAAVTLAQFKSATNERFWLHTNHFEIFIDGRRTGGSWSIPKHTRPFYSFFQDHVADALPDLHNSMAAHMPSMPLPIKELAQAAEWWKESRSTSTLPRILMDVRLLEFVASRTHVDWEAFCSRAFKHWWALDELRRALYDDIRQAGEVVRDDDNRAELNDIFARILGSGVNHSVQIDLRLALRSLSRILELMPSTTFEARRVRRLAASTANVEAVSRALDDNERHWFVLLRRTARVRNALAHGGPVTARTAESVVEFADRLSASAVAVLSDAVLNGNDLSDLVGQYRQSYEAAWDAARSGSDVEAGLFPATHI